MWIRTLSIKTNVVVLVIVCGLGLSCSRPREAQPATSLPKDIFDDRAKDSDPSDEYGPIIATYGPPDRDDSTAYDTPRPPIVTRFVEYRPENVKIAFFPVGTIGDPPPYRAWKVIGYIDISTNAKISNEQAADRLRRRNKHQ